MAKLLDIPNPESALPGREKAISLNYTHAVFGTDMRDVPAGCEVVWLALGCFWGAERLFWQLGGVKSTAAGYAGGYTENPTYEEVCSGLTGHTEIVQVVYNPSEVSLAHLLKVFWEAHDPTQGMRQGNDIGTQYRSAIYVNELALPEVKQSFKTYQKQLLAKGYGDITTEIATMKPFFYAEQYHQQYLHKNPNGYCGLKGTGAVCPV